MAPKPQAKTGGDANVDTPKLKITLKVNPEGLAEIHAKSHAQEPEKKKKRKPRVSTTTSKPRRSKIGRPRKGSVTGRSDGAIDDHLYDGEATQIDAEARKAHKLSVAHLVKTNMAKWQDIGRHAFNPEECETVLVKLSKNTLPTPVTVPKFPRYLTPSVQAMIAASHYTMQAVDREIARRESEGSSTSSQCLSPNPQVQREPSSDCILLEGPPRMPNLHGHPSPVLPPSSVTTRTPIQPIIPGYKSQYAAPISKPTSDCGTSSAATRDYAYLPGSHIKRSMDIDIGTARLENYRKQSQQYIPVSNGVLDAARSMAHADDINASYIVPRDRQPVSVHDRLISEMQVAAERMHYRRRVRLEYRQYTALICRSVVCSDSKQRGPFVISKPGTGASITQFNPNGAARPDLQNTRINLGYRRQDQMQGGPQQSMGNVNWRTPEEWRQILESRGVSLGPRERQRLGLDLLPNRPMTEADIYQAMSMGYGWDVERDIDVAVKSNRHYQSVHTRPMPSFRGRTS